MGATKNINIRVAPDRKLALQTLADAFGESVTEFVMKSVFLRAKYEKPATGENDPFVVALRAAATKGPKYKLTKDELAALNASREARARGERGLSVSEAKKLLWELEDAHKKKR